jgi:hypothetical protein
MLAAAPDFHHMRCLGFLAVFAAEFAAFFGRTITRPVRAFANVFFRH